MHDLITLEDIELPQDPISLPDGSELNERQSQACFLYATQNLNMGQIAELVGYGDRAACSKFINSNKGKSGVRAALTQHLNEGARVGLQAMIRLAKEAKSENVRQLAAADLMDRAQLRLEGAPEGGGGTSNNREVNININLTGAGEGMRDVTLDHEDKHDG